MQKLTLEFLLQMMALSVISLNSDSSDDIAKLSYSEIWTEAFQTARNWWEAQRQAKEKITDAVEPEIPERYWTSGIKHLKPTCIYDHLGNIAIVLKDVDGVGEGVYTGMLESSYKTSCCHPRNYSWAELMKRVFNQKSG
jgi:hypothetical protein